MTHKYLKLAGSIVRISGKADEMPERFGNLTPFLTESQPFDWDISVQIVEHLDLPCGDCIFTDGGKRVYQLEGTYISYIGSVGITLDGAYLRLERNRCSSKVQVKRSALLGRLTANVLISALEAEHLIVLNNGFLLHSSYISYQGGAILFTAPSGTGKSTQAALWNQYREAEIINGDRSAVRIGAKNIEACGIPFSGSSGICKDRILPLKAIVCLSQAPSTSIRQLSPLQAFRLIWEGCTFYTWSREDTDRCSQTLLTVISQVPVYHLACTPDESAVIALEQALESRN